ncbi:MAG: copper chaperone CopZ [Candidatus Thalassarchaeaceae archaeon]|jgi:copper chaperone CopZ
MIETTTITVQGMTCTGCSSRVTESLLSLDGIVDALVSHESGNALITVSSRLLSPVAI